MKPYLVILFLVLCGHAWCQNTDKKLVFDGDGKLISFPYSTPITSSSRNFTIDVAQYTAAYKKVITDTLKEIAKRLTAKYTDSTSQVFLDFKGVFGDTNCNKYVAELARWSAYLNSAAEDLPADITHFPAKAKYADIKYKLFAPNEKDGIDLSNTPFPTPIDEKWLMDSLYTTFRFKLVVQDYFKNLEIDYYNANNATGYNGVNSIQQAVLSGKLNLDAFYGRVNKALFQLKGIDSLGCLNLGANSLDGYQHTIDKAKLLLDSTSKINLAATLVANKDFFIYWLWFSNGEIRFNPFDFTNPGKFVANLSHNDTINWQNAVIYEAKIKQALDSCIVCRLNKDSLITWLMQRGRGDSIFARIDSINAIAANKMLFTSFQQAGNYLYNFSYPYRRDGDSAIYTYQFDAARKYKRVDIVMRFPLAKKPVEYAVNSGRLKRLGENLIDKTQAYLGIHNLPADTKLKYTENAVAIKDQSGFQAGLDTVTGGAASVALLVNPVGALVGGLAVAFSGPNPPVNNGQLNVTAVSVPGIPKGGESFTEGSEKAHELAPPRKPYSLTIGGVKFVFPKLDANGQIPDCKNVFKKILKKLYPQPNVDCYDNIVTSFLSEPQLASCPYCKLNNTQAYKDCIDALLKAFEAYSKKVIDMQSEVRTVGPKLQTALKDAQNNSLIKHLQLAPDNLTATDAPAAGIASYRTEIRPLGSAQTLTKDSYQIKALKGKDTTGALVAAGNVNKAPAHILDIGVGFGVTINKVALNSVATASNGQLTINRDVQPVRFIAGLHIYPGKLFNLDNRFIVHRGFGSSSYSRLSIFLGVGLPDAGHNFYTGLSADLVPGLRLHTGVHWLWYTKYQIQNNQVVDKASAPKCAGLYLGITVSPVSGVKSLLNSFK